MKLPQSATSQQMTDQTAKGGVLGLATYGLMKANLDPAFTAMALPLIAAGLSWVSTRIGDPQVASFIGTIGVDDGKPVKVAAKSAKKAPVKKAVKK